MGPFRLPSSLLTDDHDPRRAPHRTCRTCDYLGGQQHYEGMWRRGLKDGRGTLALCSGGAFYEGRFREDAFDGQGTLELHEPLPGAEDGDWVIPLDVKVDVARAHAKAGFDAIGR